MNPSNPSSARRSSLAAVIGSDGTLKGSLFKMRARSARHVNSFPKGIGAEKDCVLRIAESLQQHIAGSLALHQQRPAGGHASTAELLSGPPEGAVAGKQHEHSTIRSVGQIIDHLDHCGAMSWLVYAGLRQIVGHPEYALRSIVEWRRQYFPHPYRRELTAQSQAGLEKFEITGSGQSRAGEHYAIQSIEQQLPQEWRQVERNHRKVDVLSARAALHPTDAGRPAGRRTQGAIQTVGHRLQP